jgi:hypothetical protein
MEIKFYLYVWQSQCNSLQWTICHSCIHNIFLVLRKYIRISLLLSNDHHMNAHNLLEHRTYLDLHIMVYKIDKNHSCGFNHQMSKQLNLASTFYMQQEPFLLIPYWTDSIFHLCTLQNYINASIYLHRHWCLILWFCLSLSSKTNFNEIFIISRKTHNFQWLICRLHKV